MKTAVTPALRDPQSRFASNHLTQDERDRRLTEAVRLANLPAHERLAFLLENEDEYRKAANATIVLSRKDKTWVPVRSRLRSILDRARKKGLIKRRDGKETN